MELVIKGRRPTDVTIEVVAISYESLCGPDGEVLAGLTERLTQLIDLGLRVVVFCLAQDMQVARASVPERAETIEVLEWIDQIDRTLELGPHCLAIASIRRDQDMVENVAIVIGTLAAGAAWATLERCHVVCTTTADALDLVIHHQHLVRVMQW